MDLLAVFRTFRRHWLAALPVLLLTLGCLTYVVFLRAPDYETTGNVVLISPPAAPLGDDGKPILKTPAGKTDNPLNRFGDQSVVVNIVSRTVSTDATREKLKAEGADPRYEIAAGLNGPVAEITAVGTSSAQAVLTAQLVAESFVDNLAALQSAQGVDPSYMITTLPVEPPPDATPKLSSTMRLGVGVLGMGILAAFFVVSVAEARSNSKLQRAEAEAEAEAAAPATGDGDGDGDDGWDDTGRSVHQPPPPAPAAVARPARGERWRAS